MIYLDNAATTFPKPEDLYTSLDYAQRTLAFNAGRGSYKESKQCHDFIEECRSFLCGKSNANSLIFTSSATHSLNLVISGLSLKEGDTVYCTPYDHNAIIRTLYEKQRLFDFNIKTMPLNEDLSINIDKLRIMMLQDKPKAIFASHVSNVTGYILPINEIGKIVKENNSIFVVDGAQAFGLVPVDIKKDNIDYYIFAGHKTLYGPFGIAGVLCNSVEINLNTSFYGGTGSDSLNVYMPESGSLRFEPSSPNIVATYGLLKSSMWTFNQNAINYERELVDYAIYQLSQIDDIVLYSPPSNSYVSIISFNIKGFSSQDIAKILDDDFDIKVRSDYHCCPFIHKYLDSERYLGTIRVSFGLFNTKDDVDKLVEALEDINMTFKDISNIKKEYQSLKDEIIADFYIPCLTKAITYKRAVGYFSSSILLEISKGLGSIALRGGKVELLVAPTLSKEDYDAIKKGYDIKEYVEKKIIDSFDEYIEYEQKEDRFGLLSYLIKENILDIKIVVLEEQNDQAMFHDKLGIMYDEEDNIIAFSGSSNETYNGYNSNYENIDVFCSWVSQDSEERCRSKSIRFDKLWKGREKGTYVIDFPSVIKNKLLNYTLDKKDFLRIDNELIQKYKLSITEKGLPSTKKINLFDYQKQAIISWENCNFKGIFDMATGTGKTFTGCGAISTLYERKKRVFVWISCPFTHLVDQWEEEVKIFNIDPIVCYGSVKKYQNKLKRMVMKFKNNRTDFACVIITNASFKSDYIQSMVKINIDDTLLLVDEAHNFGAYQMSKCLNLDYPYRLALSATLDRYGDPIGTQKLYDFFGQKCITYTLERAIEEQKLTPYMYYPILVNLSIEESNAYEYLTNKIRKIMKYHDKDSDDIPDEVNKLLIKRARLVAGAENKIDALKSVLFKYKKSNNLLVYCGAVKYGQYGYNECNEEKRQIKVVSELMTKELHMKVSRFTSEETIEERRNIIDSYKNEDIQALVAIKCLDEGMNVPAIKTAFILASSTNPKEYIQRRGRVLRKSEGKIYAEIYDFVTLPRSIKQAQNGMFDKENDLGLVKRELSRVIDFASLSSNPSYSNKIIDLIYNSFDLDIIQEEVDLYE